MERRIMSSSNGRVYFYHHAGNDTYRYTGVFWDRPATKLNVLDFLWALVSEMKSEA